MKVRRGGRDTVLHKHNLCARRRCANAATPALSRERKSVPILEVDGWVLGAVWMGAEDLIPTRIRPRDSSGPTESLYRLSYPGHQYLYVLVKNMKCDAFRLLLRIYTLFMYLFIYLFICLFAYLLFIYFYLIIYLFVYLFTYLFIYLFTCLFIFI
jgi:hypothetical protein